MQLPVARTQLWTSAPHSSTSGATTSDVAGSQADTSADGVWTIVDGSEAGFRCQVSVLGRVTSLVGHSATLTGSIEVAGGHVAAGSFRIDLASLRMFGKSNACLNRMIDTARYPVAIFVLDEPISLNASPLMNGTYRAPATGSLTMHGVTRPVTFTFTARHTRSVLEGAGSIAVRFSDWELKAPFGVRDDGAIDFTLRMRRPSAEVSALRSRGTGTSHNVAWSLLDS